MRSPDSTAHPPRPAATILRCQALETPPPVDCEADEGQRPGSRKGKAGEEPSTPGTHSFCPVLLLISGETPLNPASPPQELLTAQNSMGGPPQYPGSRLGGGYVAPENNISSALSMDLVGQGLAHKVLPSDLLPLSLTSCLRQGHPPSC